MSGIAIRANNLGKRYRIGERQRYLALRDVLAQTVKAPLRIFRRSEPTISSNGAEYIWALKDASFEVPEGEVVGIIGRNGAGKSTLLKILARITKPTRGFAKVHGRMGSLLEVGTGFHPELTGRENVYLSGAILGMKKREIEHKFDEIVAFAEIDKFVDTPVKHYSSGMYLRLAFAVAAHMETEILVIDEVLSVGDAEFQKKCLGKVEDAAKTGRTVLLVSHNMASISLLCTSTVLLNAGRLEFYGSTDEAIELYTSAVRQQSARVDLTGVKRLSSRGEKARVTAVELLNHEGKPCAHLRCGEDLSIRVTVEGWSDYRRFLCVVLIKTSTGIKVLHIPTPTEMCWPQLSSGHDCVVTCTVPNCRLYPGTYFVSIWLGRNAYQEVDWLPDVLAFDVEQGALLKHGFEMSWSHGLYFCDSEWSVNAPQEMHVCSKDERGE